MDNDMRVILNTALIILASVAQFLMKIGPDNARMTALERRIAKIEERLDCCCQGDQAADTRSP
jgi:hypothetical protein